MQNPKSTTFSPLVPAQSPLKIEEKNSKNISKYLIFGPKKFMKNFYTAVSTRYYIQKKNLKTKVVPGTKYGVFRYLSKSILKSIEKSIIPKSPIF